MTLTQFHENHNNLTGKEMEKPTGNNMVMSYVESVKYYNLSERMSFEFYQWLNKNRLSVEMVLDSSIGEYGYLRNGNTVTIFPNVPVIVSGGIKGIVYISDISGATHSIANTVGWNNWTYQGCYNN